MTNFGHKYILTHTIHYKFSLHCTPCIDFYSYNYWPCTSSWM